VTKIVEIDGGENHDILGQLRLYERQREVAAAQEEAQYARQQAMLAKEQAFIDKFKRARATAAQASRAETLSVVNEAGSRCTLCGFAWCATHEQRARPPRTRAPRARDVPDIFAARRFARTSGAQHSALRLRDWEERCAGKSALTADAASGLLSVAPGSIGTRAAAEAVCVIGR